MSLFGKKYAFNRQGAAQTVSKFLEKTATSIAAMNTSNKPMGERLENMIAKAINDDEDIQIIMRRIASKFGIDVEMIIVPKVNDTNLMIENYMLAVPNAQGVLVPAVVKKDCDELYTYLTQVALTNDEALMKGFCSAVEKAVNSK